MDLYIAFKDQVCSGYLSLLLSLSLSACLVHVPLSIIWRIYHIQVSGSNKRL